MRRTAAAAGGVRPDAAAGSVCLYMLEQMGTVEHEAAMDMLEMTESIH